MQTRSLSKIGAKIVIALDGKKNGNGGVFAAEGNGGSSDQRTMRLAGTIAMKRGWKASVKIFSKDTSWVAKSSSGFSCHLLKTFNECADKTQAQVLAQMFNFSSAQMTDSSPTVSGATSAVMRATDIFANIATTVPSILVRIFMVTAFSLAVFCDQPS